MSIASVSLFEPDYASPIGAGFDWISGTLLGSVAVSLCVLAVAVLGFMMLAGRVPIRQGARIVIGCFILLGAPVIASGLLNLSSSGPSEPIPLPPRTAQLLEPREELPPAQYDPYAGASLRSD